MAGSVRVVAGPAGEPLAVKRGTGPAAARLREEAATLERVAGSGAVRLVHLDQRSDGTVELATVYVGPRTLADAHGPMAADAVAELGAAIASTLARAHGAGVVHGRLTPDHVLLGPDRRPVLCGWGASAPDARPADDVAAVGRLLLELLPPGSTAGRTATVRAVAANCVTLATDARPPMAAVAAALEAATRPPPRRRRPDPLRRGRRAVVATAATVALVVVGAVLLAAAGGSNDGGAPSREEQASSPAETSAAGAVTAPPTRARRVWPPEAERTSPASEPVLEHAGVRYAVGAAGDLAVVGDWTCSGNELPVVVRPSSGTVYVFDAWPAGDDAPVGRRAAEVGPAVAAAPDDVDGDGCVELAVTRVDGTTVVVRPMP